MTSAAASKALSSGGQAFFGSLCAGTFCLGVWQTQRYFEKQTLMAQRDEQLQMPPITTLREALRDSTHGKSFRRWQVQGQFHHQAEVLVGPRGLPPGALPKKVGQQGIMGDSMATTGPQGYFVVTPFTMTEEDATSRHSRTVLVNRGWVPKEFVDGATNTKGLWSQPQGPVKIMAIPTEPEEPKWITPLHDFSKRPLRLIFFDKTALKTVLEQLRQHLQDKAKASNPQQSQHDVTQEDASSLMLLTEIKKDQWADAQDKKLQFPLQSPSDKVGEFKVTPPIHASYAVTWFALSGAGLYMTRKLMRKVPK